MIFSTADIHAVDSVFISVLHDNHTVPILLLNP